MLGEEIEQMREDLEMDISASKLMSQRRDEIEAEEETGADNRAENEEFLMEVRSFFAKMAEEPAKGPF